MNLNLTGKNALVCGSTQGIGYAAAMELAELGANVFFLARNEERLQAAVREASARGDGHHRYFTADFGQPSQVREVAAAIAKDHTVHILINNTGGPPGGRAIGAGIEEFRTAFNQHLINNQQLVQALVPGMREAGYGRIINVISTSVKQPLNNLGVSNTIRGAVANWSKTLANELGADNITVNNVLPGATATARLDSIIANKAAKTGQSQDDVHAAMAGAVPMKRVGQPEEVGQAIAFLASPAASYINGINLPVDGGRTACL